MRHEGPQTPRAASPGRRSRAWLACVLPLVAFGAGACGEKDCTAIGPPSSFVRIVDRDGAPIPDARLFRRVPGAADVPLRCTTTPASETCEGRAVSLPAGATILVASRADGSSRVEKTVTIVENGTEDCSDPAPQQITIVLDP